MTITFCRLRPCTGITEVFAATRRREGTTVLEGPGLTLDDHTAAWRAGVLAVETSESLGEAPAYLVDPIGAAHLVERGIPGWRITLTAGDQRSRTLDALVRSRAAFLRVGRRQVGEAVELARLPGVSTVVSVFVDDVASAVTAVEAGAGDLLLRDWGLEGIGELRQALAPRVLIERTAFPIDVDLDTLRTDLAEGAFTAWLHLVDGRGAVRPRTDWAPGKDVAIPWVSNAPPEGLEAAGDLRPILERSLDGRAPDRHEVELLFRAQGEQVEAVAWTADRLRAARVGDLVTYVINRNINYTNQCYFRCGFCAFSKGPRSLNLRGEPYLMTVEEVVARAEEAAERGATEVCLQGGIHPDFTGAFYLALVEGIKSRLPAMHVHGFTPLEVWQGAETLGVTVETFLARLREAGLGSLPGTAAEILDDSVRIHLCPDKIRTAQWAEVMITAHRLGLRATATMMFGHIDGPASWANHFEVIRDIQRRTGGFTEFVPLPFVHMGAPIYLRGLSRPGPTWDEVVLVHAVARLAFDGLIPNIQASWVKLGLDGGARLLEAGCNDLGGTLMNEIITRSAGASHGQEVTAEDFEAVITAAGRTPAQRTTTYEIKAPRRLSDAFGGFSRAEPADR